MAEQTAVDIREGFERLVHIRVAVFRTGVKYLEQLDESLSEFIHRELRHIVMEHVLRAQDAGIFRI